MEPKIYQDYTKIVNICIYHNIYGPACGGILSFPPKGLSMRGGIVKQGGHLYIYIDIDIDCQLKNVEELNPREDTEIF